MCIRTTGSDRLRSRTAIVVFLAAALLLASAQASAAGSRYARLLADQAGRAKLQTLAAMEEARTIDGIERFVTDRDPLIRLRCAEVLGRAGTGEAAVKQLSVLARDKDAEVAKTAIYSLGLTMDEHAVDALGAVLDEGMKPQWIIALDALGITRQKKASKLAVPFLKNFHAEVRAAAATAIAVIGDSSAAGECVNSLFDPDPRVVARVAYALGRLGHEHSAEKITPLLGSENAEVRARAAEALGRLRSKNAAKAIARLLGDTDRMCAVKAAEALGRIATDDCAELLEPLLRSDDPWMRSLALQGIAASGRKKSCDAVLPLLGDRSVMVRRFAIEAAACTDGGKSRDPILAMTKGGAPYDRMAALEWLGHIGRPEDAALLASVLASSEDHLEREGAAAGLGRLPDRGLLFEVAPGVPTPFHVLLETAGDDDWVVGTMSIDALGPQAKDAVDTLASVFHRFPGRVDADRRLAVIAALERTARDMDDPARSKAVSLLGEAMMDNDPRVREAAAGAGAAFGVTLTAAGSAPPWDRGAYPWGPPSLPLGERRIRITTAKGPIEIVLFGDDAPNVVRSILLLAEEGFYNGLNFHRVVPGFVAQGGCPRGDGWGDAGWFLRSQFNMHRYERGAVGMAHSGKDTPGSQFFITYTAQPHLDGRYTVIGKVVSGMDVVDRLEIGDTFGITILQ